MGAHSASRDPKKAVGTAVPAPFSGAGGDCQPSRVVDSPPPVVPTPHPGGS